MFHVIEDEKKYFNLMHIRNSWKRELKGEKYWKKMILIWWNMKELRDAKKGYWNISKFPKTILKW